MTTDRRVGVALAIIALVLVLAPAAVLRAMCAVILATAPRATAPASPSAP